MAGTQFWSRLPTGLIFVSLSILVPVFGHSCYVCISNGARTEAELNQMLKTFPNVNVVRRCDEYTSEERQNFILKCPADSSGCLTVFNEGSVSRTCSRISINDCKTVNGITYCYCKNELCNSPDSKLADPEFEGAYAQPSKQRLEIQSDDEDLSGGSIDGDGPYDEMEGSGEGRDIGEYPSYSDYPDSTDPPPFIVVEERPEKEEDVRSTSPPEDIGFDDFDEIEHSRTQKPDHLRNGGDQTDPVNTSLGVSALLNGHTSNCLAVVCLFAAITVSVV